MVCVAVVGCDGMRSVEFTVDDRRRDEGSFGAIRYRVAQRWAERVVRIYDVVSCGRYCCTAVYIKLLLLPKSACFSKIPILDIRTCEYIPSSYTDPPKPNLLIIQATWSVVLHMNPSRPTPLH